ncbi:MAG: hypothetical protein R2909_13205 [Gemmatimonadales bacterium]
MRQGISADDGWSARGGLAAEFGGAVEVGVDGVKVTTKAALQSEAMDRLVRAAVFGQGASLTPPGGCSGIPGQGDRGPVIPDP